MMENVFEILKDLPKPGDYVLLTVAKGSAAGEKAILAEKKIIWESSDNNIATVTEQGVIYAKKPGTVTITASANNDVSRTVKVTVVKMKNPIIKASDEIETNQWHNKPYTLKFSGSENGVAYYYGKTEKDRPGGLCALCLRVQTV